jgi:hypothetical protein
MSTARYDHALRARFAHINVPLYLMRGCAARALTGRLTGDLQPLPRHLGLTVAAAALPAGPAFAAYQLLPCSKSSSAQPHAPAAAFVPLQQLPATPHMR